MNQKATESDSVDEWIQASGSGLRPTRKRGRNPIISGATRFARGAPLKPRRKEKRPLIIFLRP